MTGNASIIFEKNQFLNNSANNGGGISITGALSTLFIECTIQNCNAIGSGGAVQANELSKSIFENCTLVSNQAKLLGAGYYGFGNSSSSFYNVSFMWVFSQFWIAKFWQVT